MVLNSIEDVFSEAKKIQAMHVAMSADGRGVLGDETVYAGFAGFG